MHLLPFYFLCLVSDSLEGSVLIQAVLAVVVSSSWFSDTACTACLYSLALPLASVMVVAGSSVLLAWVAQAISDFLVASFPADL